MWEPGGVRGGRGASISDRRRDLANESSARPALAEIYTGMLSTCRNGFCNADGTFALKAINTVTSGRYKLGALRQIGLFLCLPINQGLSVTVGP